MKLSGKKGRSPVTTIIIILTMLLTGGYVMISFSPTSQKKTKNDNVEDIDMPTKIYRGYKYSEVIKKEINQIYKDSLISIHLNSELGKPFLLYVYKDSLSPTQRSDKFFLHAYLKDSSSIKKVEQKEFINLDFYGKPIELGIENRKHFLFKRFLEYHSLSIQDIKHINTGRFSSKGASLRINEIEILDVVPENVSGIPNKLTISIKEKDFEKIKDKRNEALENEVLLTDEDDLLKAKVSYDDNPEINADIRLKGDWTDHLEHPTKWSFRIILNGTSTISGQRKFSIQHPKVRNYVWEWLFNKAIKQNDLIGLRYNFIDVNLNIVHKQKPTQTIAVGIMAMEEAFDKILIESNSRREGLLLGFDESMIWKDREHQYRLNLPDEARSAKLQSINNAPIKVYNENRVLADPTLKKQFEIAKNLFEGLRTGKLKISEVFDIDKLTTFMALANLFGGKHGFILHNLRIYYNPITNKFEPVSFDSNSGEKINEIIHYPFSAGDDLYMEKLVEKLQTVSSTEFVNRLLTSSFDELSELSISLNKEFEANFDLSVLEYNSNVIKKKINPSSAIVANLLSFDNDQMAIEMTNLSDLPVLIQGIEHEKGKRLNDRLRDDVLYSNETKTIDFALKQSFDNAFVSKKNKKGGFRYPKDVEKIKIKYNIIGLPNPRTAEIIPYPKESNLSNAIVEYKESFQSTLSNFDFVETDHQLKEIKFKAGNHKTDKTILIPAGFRVNVEKGFALDLVNNASLISYSYLVCNGTKDLPIRFYSSDSTGAGLFISNTDKKSKLEYTYFNNLSNPKSKTWSLTGAVNFHEADVEIDHSVFEGNRCEDGLNIIRSEFLVENSLFENTYSDAFDGDFVKGSLKECQFVNTGNDGVDISGSEVFLNGIEIRNPADKAISAGEASTIKGSNIRLNGGEIGIVSKDLSTITLEDVNISNTRLAFSAFQKKSEFGNGIIEISNLSLVNNGLDYLIEDGSSLTIDNELVTTVATNVIDQMYGNEYGKSSK